MFARAPLQKLALFLIVLIIFSRFCSRLSHESRTCILTNFYTVCQHRFFCHSLARNPSHIGSCPPLPGVDFVCYQTPGAFVNTVRTCTFWQPCRLCLRPFCAALFSEHSSEYYQSVAALSTSKHKLLYFSRTNIVTSKLLDCTKLRK